MSAPTKKKVPTFDPTKTPEAAGVKKRAVKRTASKPAAIPKAGPAVATEVALPFEVHYERGKGKYWYQEQSGRWEGYNVEDFRRRLRMHGIGGRCEEGALVSPQDRVITLIQETLAVDYCGPIAGHLSGLYEFNGQSVIVSVSPRLPLAVAGEWQTLRAFLEQLCGVGADSHGDMQLQVLLLWVARAYRSIAEQKMMKGQALIIAGEPGSGKTLLQEEIITSMIGGRAVKARDYLLGKTDFNGNLFAGEHLMLSDEQGSRDFRSRRDFGQKLKDLVANGIHSAHYKGRDPMTLPARWRVTISVNDEAEHLQTLPPVSDKDVADKVHLLRLHSAVIPADDDERMAWLAQMKAEVPACIYYALALPVPAELKEDRPRFGSKAFHHPELLERLNSFSPEVQLLEVVDKVLFFPTDEDPWRGSASELRQELLERTEKGSPMQREIENLLSTAAICGQYLARLAHRDRYPDRFIFEGVKESGTKRVWCIHPPVDHAS